MGELNTKKTIRLRYPVPFWPEPEPELDSKKWPGGRFTKNPKFLLSLS